LEFSVRLVGDGPLLPQLKSQARQLGIERLVQFLELRNDIPDLLKDSTFLIHTADHEGCPNVVMEAMACGRAVIGTDAGDIPVLVEDGKTGFVVRRGDDTTLVERTVQLITERDLCRCMGQAGRAKAEREFGVDRLVMETLASYRAAGWKDV
jgi:glycosyltransferase involved in cell wall biosynthesis